mmetsp:Transcript_126452/g.366078  ORF Transcript_126452/g.366078 Transcript_126452/m.366078 type:complete len:264 (-) Transcript_126452:662-1453(-)
MPASNAFNSSANVARAPVISSMAVSESLIESSKLFRLSSDSSNCVLQYSFFCSSDACSFFKFETIVSIMDNTFSKPAVLPVSANARRSNWGLFVWRADSRRIFAACRLSDSKEAVTCTKLLALALGKVFLNISKASSSLRTLIVSESASNSSARVFLTSSHSCSFVAQPCSNSALNFWSAARACSVSSRSLDASASSTPKLPTRVILSSICACNVSTSFFLAAVSSSKLVMADVSAAVASLKLADISSDNCFRIPVISPLWGT